MDATGARRVSMVPIALDASARREMLARLLRYVQVDTQSDPDSTSSPSTTKQKDLGRILVDELRALGCEDARLDEWSYVYAAIPGNLPRGHPATGKVPAIGLIAHMDTYYGVTGARVRPQVIERYQGGDIRLPGDARQVITAADNPNLARCVGHTLISSDGTTLLGADDKAGIAEIMTAVAWMRQHPELHHGPVRIAFTPDEEVARGTAHFDVPAFGAQYAYTLDGKDLGEIEDETFCADSGAVVIEGHDVHPGYAKGKMVNAARVAAALIERLPSDALPETTEDRQPYLHPYGVSGDVQRVEMKLIFRAFTPEELQDLESAVRRVIAEVERRFPGARISFTVQETYRNMRYKIAEDPKVLEYAIEAVRRLGITPVRTPIRGGTDGARLSFMGLLTPNLWAGGQNLHSVQEWVSLDWMAKATEAALTLLQIWLERSV